MMAVPHGAERRSSTLTDWMRSPNPYSYAIHRATRCFSRALVPRSGRDNTRRHRGHRQRRRTRSWTTRRSMLRPRALTFANIVTRASTSRTSPHFQTMNDAYRAVLHVQPAGPRDRPVRALSGPRLSRRDDLRPPRRQPREVGREASGGIPISPAIRAGPRVYLSGMLGNRSDREPDRVRPPTASPRRRARRSPGSARRSQAGGSTPADVVDALVYLHGRRRCSPAMNAEYRAVLRRRTFQRARRSATGLVPPDGLVEIMVTAVKP